MGHRFFGFSFAFLVQVSRRWVIIRRGCNDLKVQHDKIYIKDLGEEKKKKKQLALVKNSSNFALLQHKVLGVSAFP